MRRSVEANGCRLILADPYIVEPDGRDPQRALSGQFGLVVGKLAGEFGAVHVRTQEAFDRVLAVSPAHHWAGDRIHPNLPGHAVIADAFLQALT